MPETTITYNGQDISVSEQTAPVSVSYNGAQIASIAAGGSKTLNCNGKVMLSNVSVGGKTLNCNGKLMQSDVLIAVAQGIDPVFANNTWEQIIEACQNNAVPDTWAVADQKAMTINGTSYMIDIIGKNHDTYTGGGTAPLTFQMHDCYGTKYKMNSNSSATNTPGWETSTMRAQYLPSILSNMPTAVKNAIREVQKTTTRGNRSTSLTTTADKLFLLSEIEAKGSITSSGSGEGSRYAYYAAGNPTAKKLAGTNTNWWLRSPSVRNTANYCAVMTQSSLTGASSNTEQGVAPAFCF